jgi:L-aminopeptidase/D-esterase-like protein
VRPGPLNLITDVPGLTVGNATDERARSGVTTVLCDRHTTAGVDVRGGAPGVRETDTLAPDSLVGAVHAIVLSGGSVFGLGAADGVTTELSARGVGLRIADGPRPLPIVPAAVLHDLTNGGDKGWSDPPYRELGRASVAAASRDFAIGSIGAGRGARAGLQAGGLGSASLDLGDGLVVGALVAVNPVGTVYLPDGRTFWAWPFEIDGEFGGARPDPAMSPVIDPAPADTRLGDHLRAAAGSSTVIAVVATSVALTTAECRRLATMAHDGIARAVRPAHTPLDGDTIFALATGHASIGEGALRAPQLARLGSAAADALARAIARGVHAAAAADHPAAPRRR